MADEVTLSVSIPTDLEGYITIQCSLCSELFKVKHTDFEDESQIQIWCPNCGLIPDSMITEEIRDLLLKTANNYMSDLLNDFNTELSKTFKKGGIEYKAGKKIKKASTDPLVSRIDILAIS